MGAATFVLEGVTPAEVRRKRTAKLTEARHEGLSLDRESKVQKVTCPDCEGMKIPGCPSCKDGEKYFAVLRVHT